MSSLANGAGGLKAIAEAKNKLFQGSLDVKSIHDRFADVRASVSNLKIPLKVWARDIAGVGLHRRTIC